MEPYYRADLALVHHLGFGFHADACAPGILRLIEPVLETDGLVVEIGCGSGELTRHLVGAGHRVVATDASPAMIDLACRCVPGAAEVRRLTLPGDEVPDADAIVSVGHVLSYLADEAALEAGLVACAQALKPGGVLAIDLCDLEWAEARRGIPNYSRAEDGWAIITSYPDPPPRRFVREISTFVRNDDGTWRRDDERHENVLVDTAAIPALLGEHGVDAEVRPSFGDETLPEGLKAIVGRKAG